MKILGLDIGTTTISAVVMENGSLLAARTENNDSSITGEKTWEKCQDPHRIRAIALAAVDELFAQYPDILRIGVTGQMHGIVYLDRNGSPVSPLFTWQDGRGDLPYDEQNTYAAHLTGLTGYPLSSGFGLVTHFYNIRNRLVPENAAVFCTIHDYIAMVLSGQTVPVTDAGDGASMGMFDVEKGHFDDHAVRTAGMDPAMLPGTAGTLPLGKFRNRAEVYPAIGDNQASFIGACGGNPDCMLCNVGTGGQFSVYTPKYMTCPGLETRPFPGGGYLLVGSSLCSGRAFALLENFFRMTVQMAGVPVDSCYPAIDRLLDSQPIPEDIPTITPLFQGTRENPSSRGSITGLHTGNMTPLHFLHGMMDGMAEELYRMYLRYKEAGGVPVKLMGSGNGLRKNRHLQDCFSRKFGQKITLSAIEEEAAAGAARYAERLG